MRALLGEYGDDSTLPISVEAIPRQKSQSIGFSTPSLGGNISLLGPSRQTFVVLLCFYVSTNLMIKRDRRQSKRDIYLTVWGNEERECRIRRGCSHHRRIRQAVSFQIPFHVGLLAFLSCGEVGWILSFLQRMPWIQRLNRNGTLAYEKLQHSKFTYSIVRRGISTFSNAIGWFRNWKNAFDRSAELLQTYSWSSPCANTSPSSVLLHQTPTDVSLSWDPARSCSCQNGPDILPCVLDKPVCTKENRRSTERSALDLVAHLFGHSSRRASANSDLYRRQTRCECVRKVVGRLDITFDRKLD